mmetsp:Transcript_12706/g.35065  ORF Transcript_12706/g.35065 Transcript_12706/m.35065 type:complete len:210 (-) Transcript_12706:142-771(-)
MMALAIDWIGYLAPMFPTASYRRRHHHRRQWRMRCHRHHHGQWRRRRIPHHSHHGDCCPYSEIRRYLELCFQNTCSHLAEERRLLLRDHHHSRQRWRLWRSDPSLRSSGAWHRCIAAVWMPRKAPHCPPTPTTPTRSWKKQTRRTRQTRWTRRRQCRIGRLRHPWRQHWRCCCHRLHLRPQCSQPAVWSRQRANQHSPVDRPGRSAGRS